MAVKRKGIGIFKKGKMYMIFDGKIDMFKRWKEAKYYGIAGTQKFALREAKNWLALCDEKGKERALVKIKPKQYLLVKKIDKKNVVIKECSKLIELLYEIEKILSEVQETKKKTPLSFRKTY